MRWLHCLAAAQVVGQRPVLVLDALDELDAALVDALTDRIIPELPDGVRVIASGRTQLPTALTAPGGVPPLDINLDQGDVAAYADIRRYAVGRLEARSELSEARVKTLVDQIVASAEGKFLYARWVLDDVAADPDLDLATWTPPKGMGNLYDVFLRRVQKQAGKDWPVVAWVLTSVAASLDPGLSVGQLAEIHDVDLFVLRGWLRDWCGHYLETDARDRIRSSGR